MKIIFRGTAEVIYPNTLDGYAEYRQFCGTRLQLFVTRPKNVAYLFLKMRISKETMLLVLIKILKMVSAL
jgi:hypothetical protein